MAGKAFEKVVDAVVDAAIEDRAPDPTLLSLADLVAALKSFSGHDEESQKRQAQYQAEAYARLEKKENTEHPQISVFSYPEGNVARPKPHLTCKTFWINNEESEDVLTPEEILLMNETPPGDYRFARLGDEPPTKSGQLAVKGEVGNNGALSKKSFLFECDRDAVKLLPGRVTMLRDVLGKGTREQELLAEIAALRAKQTVTA